MAEPIVVPLGKTPAEPWGFRLQGGFEFQKPLMIQRVNEESASDRAGLKSGDLILAINGQDCSVMTHKAAQDIIVNSGNGFEMVIQRGGSLQSSTWKPEVQPVGEMPKAPTNLGQTFTKTSLAKDQQHDSHWDVKYNTTPRGFNPAASVGGFQPTSLLANTSSGSQTGQSSNSNSPTPLGGFRSVAAPITKPRAPGQTGSQGAPPFQGGPLSKCFQCDGVLTGVFVKVSGKTMHAECFKCTTCGGPLKNVGYFNISDKLYCENCARAAKAAQIIGIQNQFKEEQQQQKLQQPQPMQQMPRPQPQPQNPPQMSQGNGAQNDWSQKLNANQAGGASNAQDFTKQFMADMFAPR